MGKIFSFDDDHDYKYRKKSHKKHHKKKKGKKSHRESRDDPQQLPTSLLVDVNFNKSQGKVEIIIVVKKIELISDEMLAEIDRQREFEEKNQVESTLKKL